ncbi:hypothetical protein RXV94_02810 [Yeosuana sp. MJ-SS3]|uniref:Uncharacterized protein n=1 Tax=Gilvirhabdus luticola TaxID=3079858 RepID=A0ABU3U3U9_9FLAO|nr:hypothetical protein [Yeosuana sp. MJ-SS3]MDU8885076.1 hypothetical protein [Yeosuana sp. MJ-SS3]
MKALKITLMLAVLFIALSSCTKQDLNEDDALINPNLEQVTYADGDSVHR